MLTLSVVQAVPSNVNWERAALLIRDFYRSKGFVGVISDRPLERNTSHIKEVFDVAVKSDVSFDGLALNSWLQSNSGVGTSSLPRVSDESFFRLDSIPRGKQSELNWATFQKRFALSDGYLQVSRLGLGRIAYSEATSLNRCTNGYLFQFGSSGRKIGIEKVLLVNISSPPPPPWPSEDGVETSEKAIPKH